MNVDDRERLVRIETLLTVHVKTQAEHGAKIAALETWRNRIVGAVLALTGGIAAVLK